MRTDSEITELTEWRNRMSEEQIVDVISEWHRLKQAAGHKFSVATGEDDWVERFIAKVGDLQDANTERRILVREIEAATLAMAQRLANRPCRNCRGSGVIRGSTCCACRGTKTFNM